MTCFHPITAYRSREVNSTGKRSLVFDERKAYEGSQPVEIACGQCIGCRLERSRQWAIRISHEASLYEQNCFITLTYSPENLPKDGSLKVRDFQLFLKRLRKAYPKSKIRFFHCGEYGEQLGRPHYHACLLNFDFPDKKHYKDSKTGIPVFRSASLERLWPFGLSEIGSVTFESAAYVARYITKKVTGPASADHYLRVDADTGEVFELKSEYVTMSRKPGIGFPWLMKFKTDVYPSDLVTIRGGKRVPPPRYYNNRYEVLYPEDYRKLQLRREKKPVNCFGSDEYARRAIENSTDRLKVREIVQLRTIETLTRDMEK